MRRPDVLDRGYRRRPRAQTSHGRVAAGSVGDVRPPDARLPFRPGETHNWLFKVGEAIRGHEFHYSSWINRPAGLPAALELAGGGGDVTDRPEGACERNLWASYVHLHFDGLPELASDSSLPPKLEILSRRRKAGDDRELLHDPGGELVGRQKPADRGPLPISLRPRYAWPRSRRKTCRTTPPSAPTGPRSAAHERCRRPRRGSSRPPT